MSLPAAAPLSPAEIARRSGSSFLVSFAFLQPKRRRAITAIYAFCRVVDDAVDEAREAEEAVEHLAFWRRELEAAYQGTPATGVGRALQEAATDFGVRHSHLEEVLQGVSTDLEGHRFGDLSALEQYCHHVASAVGLACLPVFGAGGPDAERFARQLGLALQLTNILRDLRSDALEGRVYVPSDWLVETGVEEAWLRGDGPSEVYGSGGPVARLAERLGATAAARFTLADEALGRLSRRDRRRLLPARIMSAVYRHLLGKLIARGGDLRRPRVRVGKPMKLFLALRAAAGGGA